VQAAALIAWVFVSHRKGDANGRVYGRVRGLLLIVLVTAPITMALSETRHLRQLGAYVPSTYDFGLPPWIPQPLEPEGNPTTKARVELGRHLFYDTRLSRDISIACVDCHRQERAFTDGRATSPGVTGEHTLRNAMSLANAAYAPTLTWANPMLRSIEQQALVPLIGERPVEMGLAGMDEEVARRLRAIDIYQCLFAEAFPEVGGEISLATITRALASFLRTLVSVNAPYDRYRQGDQRAISPSAIRGEELFFGERLECHHCHIGIHVSGPIMHARSRVPELAFHNTGLYNIDGRGGYPANNTGVQEITGRPEDMGRFRAPSLRNVAVTAPYMHDGSVATLDAVIDHYAAGGRTIAKGRPYAGVGRDNPLKSSFVPGFSITPEERRDLLAFLDALTDEAFLHDRRFGNPWLESNAKLQCTQQR